MTTPLDIDEAPTDSAYATSYDDAPNRYTVTPPRREAAPSPASAAAAYAGLTDERVDEPAAGRTTWAGRGEPDEQSDDPTKTHRRIGYVVIGGGAALTTLHFFGPLVAVAAAGGGVVVYLAGRAIARGGPGGRAGRGLGLPKLGKAGGGASRRSSLLGKAGGARAGRAGKGLGLPKLGGRGGRTSGARSGGLPKLGGRGGRTSGARSGGLPKLGRNKGLGLPKFGRRSAGAGLRSGGLLGLAKAPARAAGRVAKAPVRAARSLNARRAAVSMPVSERPRTLRELLGAARAASRARAKAEQDWYWEKWLPSMGRKARRAAAVVTVVPAVWAARTLVWRPSRWLGRALVVRPTLAVTRRVRSGVRAMVRRAVVRARWARIFAVPAAWRAFLARVVPGWWRQLREVAKAHGFATAAAAAFLAAFAAVATFFRETLPGWMWAREDAGARHRAPGDVDAWDDERDGDHVPWRARRAVGDPPVSEETETKPERPAAQPVTVRPAGPVTVGDQAGTQPGSGGVAVHANLQKIIEASSVFVRGFKPRSIPDFWPYVQTQDQAMIALAEKVDLLGSRLSASFPGAVNVHEWFQNWANGYRGMAVRAHAVAEAYAALHPGDIERHLAPRVNEHRADVAKGHAGNPGGMATINATPAMHSHHANMIDVFRQYIGMYDPGTIEEDEVAELMGFLSGIPQAMMDLSGHVKDFANHLVEAYPVDMKMHAYYYQLAGGYVHLAGQGSALAVSYAHRNPHDVQRRTQPRTNEAWADYCNV